MKNYFDIGVIQWHVLRARLCIALADTSVTLRRSSLGLCFAAFLVSVHCALSE